MFLEQHMSAPRAGQARGGEPDVRTFWIVDTAQDLVDHDVWCIVAPPPRLRQHYVSGWSSDQTWSFWTQVLQDQLDRGFPVKDMAHEPTGFRSGTHLQRCAAVGHGGQEGFAAVSTFKRLGFYFLEWECISSRASRISPILSPEASYRAVVTTTEHASTNGRSYWPRMTE